MSESIRIKLARKLRNPFLRKWVLQPLFRSTGLHLRSIHSMDNDRFHLYHVGNYFIPNESIFGPVSLELQLKKCRNESLFYYEPRKGDVLLDIGAGLGEETLLFSYLAGSEGRVLAMEANPAVFRILEKTVSLNHLSNTEAYNIAVFSENGHVSGKEGSSSYETWFIRNEPGTAANIPALTMDQFFRSQQVKQVDLLKVNIEGAERFVVDTITPEQFRMIRHVAIACHDFRYREEGNDFFRTKDHVTLVLQENGFNIQTRQTGIGYLDDWVYGTNKF